MGERRPIALLANFVPEEAEEVRQYIRSWRCLEYSRDWAFGEAGQGTMPDVILVSGLNKTKQGVLCACLEARNERRFKGIPLMVVISQYQMHIANEVDSLALSDYIIVPIDEAILEKKLACFAKSSRETDRTAKER